MSRSGLVTCLMCAGTLALMGQPAAAAVSNAGFETGDFTSWSTFSSGWRVSNFPGDQHGGTYGAVNDVFPADTDVFRGVHQSVSVTPGVTYTGGAWIRAVALDGDSQSWYEVQFFDGSNNLLQQFQSAHVLVDQPFTFMTAGPMLAPAGSVTASVRGIVFRTGTPSDTDFHIFDDFVFVPEPSGTLAILGVAGLVLTRRRSMR